MSDKNNTGHYSSSLSRAYYTPGSVPSALPDLIITSQQPYKQVLLLSPLRGKLRLEKVNHLLKALRPGFRTRSVCLQSPACSCTEPGSVYYQLRDLKQVT